jgi:hypothetical protein
VREDQFLTGNFATTDSSIDRLSQLHFDIRRFKTETSCILIGSEETIADVEFSNTILIIAISLLI